MKLGELKAELAALSAPDDSEVLIADGFVNEPDEVNQWDYRAFTGLARDKEVEYRDSPAIIGIDFDLAGLAIEPLLEMNAKLGTSVRPAVIFRPILKSVSTL